MSNKQTFHYEDGEAYIFTVKKLKQRGIDLEDICKKAIEEQKKHGVETSLADARRYLINLLHKREIMNVIMVGIYLDEQAEKGLLDGPLQDIIESDAPSFGLDESFAFVITSLFGSIAGTNFGALDVNKTGVAKELDNSNGRVNTFLDDIFSALVASLEAKIAHEDF
ncbi:phosphatidylglycerophosphatase A [Lactobacillus phage Ldl1]|uniref:Phosphatidylglycerophosphatase A n=1 Tax=Lactobacillus phage Ldl1 TaxID=1552735 RepID=A0A0A7DMW7_9CAUD|nr:phosphatidylglycerophosphatase A [Lactobacillus phage Ldl1]AIS73911.1 phosphatidylglycerophosphatase A [Lactobacillus phage Ldl1]